MSQCNWQEGVSSPRVAIGMVGVCWRGHQVRSIVSFRNPNNKPRYSLPSFFSPLVDSSASNGTERWFRVNQRRTLVKAANWIEPKSPYETLELERDADEEEIKVTRLVKKGTGKTTLAIGDGANDVGMIQEVDIGVGQNPTLTLDQDCNCSCQALQERDHKTFPQLEDKFLLVYKKVRLQTRKLKTTYKASRPNLFM
ncbi:hypothetical protein L484_013951 [Morus notabilis]|uniref:Uncharacterized protein n=1 Tax=Morus notabilis TaxID=981085 RepID=W9R997_9ROSA|nr:hypothetical protein L484_013951 [Morus notabilis]